jgi:hypothetical protein
MLDTVTSIAGQAGSRLNITDQRSPGASQDSDLRQRLCARS